MEIKVTNLLILLFFASISKSWAWNNEELEIFDVVEEVNKNFYELMGISQDASVSEIKKAYRTLSKQLHPDKNKAADAEVQFRQLAAVYDILREPGKRELYNRILIEGLPDWRSPIFYYRRARKLSLLECCAIITVVVSITQYLMAWGSYLDKKHTMEEYLCKKYKIKDRGRKKQEDIENALIVEKELLKIPSPKCWDILPIQICRLIVYLALNGPSLVRSTFFAIKEERLRKQEKKKDEEEEIKRVKEEEERKRERKAQMKQRKKVSNLPDYTGMEEVSPFTSNESKQIRKVEQSIPVIVGGPWTDEDFMELARLMAKYPGGTVDRWETIASLMGRTVFEVTKMSNKVMAELAAKVAPIDEPRDEVKVKHKTRGGKGNTGNESCEDDYSHSGSDEMWSVIQQKNLEKALKQFPKGTDQRWDRIARCVPDKNKEECMTRFKFLVERVKRKKEEEKCETVEDQDNRSTLTSFQASNGLNEICDNKKRLPETISIMADSKDES